MPPMLATSQLSYRAGGRQLVKDLALAIPEAEVYGLLGLNGAGKTTTLKLLCGLLTPHSGTVSFAGREVRCAEHRRGLAAVIDGPAFVPALTGFENVLLFARLHGPCSPADAREALTHAGLDPQDRRAVRVWSLGMKQRLGLAMALATRPRMLVLDEPTNGLDPAGIADLRLQLPRLARESGMTVLMSSHLLDEVEHCCTQVGVLREGALILQCPLEELRRQGGWQLRVRGEAARWIATCAQILAPAHTRATAHDLLHIDSGPLPADEIVQRLVSAGVPVCGFVPASRLESVLLGTAEACA